MSKEFLRRLPLFAGLSEEDLDQLYQMAEPVFVPAGQLLMEEGTEGDALYVVLDGEYEVTKRSGQQEIVLAVRGAGEVIGEISLLSKAPRNASVRMLQDSHLLKISQTMFQDLLASSPSAVLAILNTVTARLRSTESMLMQHEKMAALGTIAAGLAHELNNPAAALRRSASQLRDTLAEWQRLTLELAALTFDQRQTEAVRTLREEMTQRATVSCSLDPLARCDAESDLQDWLEARGVDQAWDLAPTLVEFGWDADALKKSTETFSDEQLAVVMPWLASGSAAATLLNELGTSAERISEIVKAVKTYSYLDQAPIQEVDVHEGLENTLVILRHKLKHGINVTRDYAKGLAHIEAYASELNQVWTNLIDNAIDAMDGRGELLIRTYPKDDRVVVEIADNGPGIPPEIQSRIFDPFFTTKAPGVGTGLGLHIVYNIIVDKHHGRIQVNSRPGETCFQVTLPTRLERGES